MPVDADFTEYPMATIRGELPPLVLERLDERYWNHDEFDPGATRVSGWSRTVIANASNGVMADGSTNDQPAIQAILDANPGAIISFPAGIYMLRGTYLRPQKGTVLRGEPGTVFTTDDPAMGDFIRIFGSYSSATTHELATSMHAGDRAVTTKTPHGYVSGDVLRLVSQRRATSDDAGEDRLGWQTTGGSGPFFSEIVTVQTVTSPTTFDLDAGLTFSNYHPDASREAASDAGSSSFFQKWNGTGDDVRVEGIRFEGTASSGLVRVIRATNVVIDRCDFRLPTRGRAVGLDDVYRTEVRNCRAHASEVIYEAAEHDQQNVFHMAGSQSSGFRGCATFRGAQCYDLTYKSTSPYPCLDCYVDQCSSHAALFNPVTLHPGVYRCRITNNNFTECREAGISIRSNAALVTGNVVSGSRWSNAAGIGGSGIYLLEGAGKHSLVADNIIENFITGLRVNDGANKPYQGWIGVQFRSNIVRNFDVGYTRIVGYEEPLPPVPQGIVLDGNLFDTNQDDAVGVLTGENGRGAWGLEVTGNTFRLPGAGTRGVVVTGNSVDTVVRGNTFAQVGQALVWDPVGVTDSSPESVVHWSGNTLLAPRIDRTPPPGAQFQIHSPDGTVHTMPTDSYSLNYARYTARFYSASSSATMGRGWPVEGFEGYVDVVRLSSSLVTQTGHGTDGRRHSRTWSSSGGWTNWKVA